MVHAINKYLAWFDGACGPINSGGTATFGAMIKDKNSTVLLREHGLAGTGRAMSNNVAEYAGVLHVLRYLACHPLGRVTVRGDSNPVTNQLNGKWRVRKGLYLAIAMEAKELLARLKGLGWQISLRWIPREQNEECDALSKKGCRARARSRSKKARRHEPYASHLPGQKSASTKRSFWSIGSICSGGRNGTPSQST